MMDEKIPENLKKRLSKDGYEKLSKTNNPAFFQFIARYVELCNPEEIFVCADTPEDVKYLRETALKNGEESKLAVKGHTIHYDNYYDQGRDKKNTGILVTKGINLGEAIETKDRDTGLKDIYEV
ncbi:MAG: phosphoenolpyruvate carboxykinase, partial [candidate division Zixibacteria bacterium]|nr:phosphoenolpyruvate carboxykinase [candidate division Zixibacteria bacterium]